MSMSGVALQTLKRPARTFVCADCGTRHPIQAKRLVLDARGRVELCIACHKDKRAA